MINIKEQIFKQYNHPIQVMDMVGQEDRWQSVIDNCSYCTIDYSWTYIELCDLVMREKFEFVETIKIGFFLHNEIIAIWPLQVRLKDNTFKIGTNEQEVLQPLYSREVSEKIQKKIISICIEILLQLCKAYNIEYWESKCHVRTQGISLWQHKLLECDVFSSSITDLTHVLYVKLQNENIFSDYRKSYKSLINKGKKKWSIVIYETINREQMDKFREFHTKVKGRATRSIDTWDAQIKAINKGQAFLISLHDENDDIRGGGVFLMTQFESYYNSAAYDKNLPHEPLGHLVQDAAINYAKGKGLKWHQVGERYYKSDKCNPSQKELEISHFKEGFATNTFINLKIRCDVKK